MASFRAPAAHAAWVMQQVQGREIKSVGSVRDYEQGLTRVAEWQQAEHPRLAQGLRGMTQELAIAYLEQRAEQVSQSTLNQERQALQVMMQLVTHKLAPDARLPVVQSEKQIVEQSRAYTQEQIALVVGAQNERNGLATEIAHAAGLRASELLTLQRIEERAPSDRPAREEKFTGRAPGERYTVHGKGGLIREVRLPSELAARLEARRLDTPVRIDDRGVFRDSRYDIAGGHAWSRSFSAASDRVLGWSAGAHGMRHSYAQERYGELQVRQGLSPHDAKETLSQELGHFRAEITECYLR